MSARARLCALAALGLLAAAPPAAPQPIALRLLRVEPEAGVEVVGRPEVSATFSEPVAPAGVRLTLDGHDVTPRAFVSEHGFAFEPEALAAGAHAVVVTGKTPDREPFHERWSFTSRDVANPNFIDGLEPPEGTSVGRTVTLGALTKPHAHIRVLATTSTTLAAFSDVARDSSSASGRADERGAFEVRLIAPTPASGILDVRVASIDDDGNVAVRTLRLRQ